MKSIRSVFLTGLLVLAPLLATIHILNWFIQNIDEVARSYLPEGLIPFDFTGFGLVLALVLIFLVGILTQNFIGSWLVEKFDGLFRAFPIVGGIYGAIKKFLDTIFNPSTEQFKEAVVVEFPRGGILSIGFLTGTPDDKLLAGSKDKNYLNVFVPCTPNFTSGFYILVPEDEIKRLDLSVQDAFKILVSMGIVSTEDDVEELPKKLQKRRGKRIKDL